VVELKARAHVRIEGIVQGVFFRKHMKERADALGVAGWVRNNPDGSVEAVLEGDIESVKELIKWALTGPPAAVVKRVCVEWEDYRGDFEGFRIVK